jgi:hypothetical protein
MGNWVYVGKGKMVCPNCQSEVDVEVRIKPKMHGKMRH